MKRLRWPIDGLVWSIGQLAPYIICAFAEVNSDCVQQQVTNQLL